MSCELAISIRGLSKAYAILQNHEKHSTLAEALLSRLKDPLSRTPKKTFWALRDVSFHVTKGEVVGIIGRNGAGKSTLLKVLSRITEPSKGEVDLHGRVGSLLEVGTGFHPELTGRENIFLNGAILGMGRAEIRRQFDAIVDFAGVERFLDTPVKRYSSGMYVRLAFAVAAHLESEILIVDEVLSVGDAAFQQKCLGVMGDVARRGRAVLFVSHNMAAVTALCGRAVLLRDGVVAAQGPSSEVIDSYIHSSGTSQHEDQHDFSGRRPRWAESLIIGVRVGSTDGIDSSRYAIGQSIEIAVRFRLKPELGMRRLNLGIVLRTSRGVPVGAVNMKMTDCLTEVPAECVGEIVCTLESPALTPGEYCIDCWLGDGFMDSDMVQDAARFAIESTDFYGSGVPPVGDFGPLVLTPRWSVEVCGGGGKGRSC